MVYMTYWFLLFALASLPLYFLIPRPSWRRFYLLFVSAIFHGHFAGPAGVLPILLVGAITYWVALKDNRRLLNGAIVLNVLALVFYKYAYFFSWEVLKALKLGIPAESLKAYFPHAPPLAISFFTFEFVHYLYDVKKGSKPIRSPVDFALFAIFWPSIVAGPVKRYQSFLAELQVGLRAKWQENLIPAMLRITSGYAKKILADNLTLAISHYDPNYFTLPLGMRWALLVAIALRIYLDFSGYSDIALGFGRMMGIRLPENFNWPYLARNLSDFWHRWHMSLSSWIRDYIYIPLGGNRYGAGRKVFNGIVAFAICGLWHGAAWNFVLWGLYHGVGLAICGTFRNWAPPLARLGRLFDRFPLLAHVLTLFYACAGWFIFFYPVSHCFRMIGYLFRP
jgi:alginate O-acetyltransferase complex protein AlgI